MNVLTRSKQTATCLGLLLAIGCTSETQTAPEAATILELTPSVIYISNGNPTVEIPTNPDEYKELLEYVKKHR